MDPASKVGVSGLPLSPYSASPTRGRSEGHTPTKEVNIFGDDFDSRFSEMSRRPGAGASLRPYTWSNLTGAWTFLSASTLSQRLRSCSGQI